jgi:KDO2-lipid IV(A) lauroyltransferase
MRASSRARTRYNPRVRERAEYAVAWLLLKTLGAMPRPMARFAGAGIAAILLWLRPGLRRAAVENLRLAFPEWSKKQRRAAIRGMVRQLGWMGAEFAHFPRYTKPHRSYGRF